MVGKNLSLGKGKQRERHKDFVVSGVYIVTNFQVFQNGMQQPKDFHTKSTLCHESFHHFVTLHNVSITNYRLHTNIGAAMPLYIPLSDTIVIVLFPSYSLPAYNNNRKALIFKFLIILESCLCKLNNTLTLE